MTAYSNRLDLANTLVTTVQRLRQAQKQQADVPGSICSTGRSDRPWRVSDRLSDAEVHALVAASMQGTPKRKLAEMYGISESSVKRLVRKHHTG